MNKIEVKWRSWAEGVAGPRLTKMQIPGWAGDSHDHKDGAKPQAWHCPPFVDAATYGMELMYPFETECHIKLVNGEIEFEGDFGEEKKYFHPHDKPFMSFAPHHYGFTSSVDIQPPDDHCIRIEPHPRFYTDRTNTVPIPVNGHIQPWWPRIFFIAFKAPHEGETHIFRKGEPYAQVLVIPSKANIRLDKMTEEEAADRMKLDGIIGTHGTEHIASFKWKDHKDNVFDNKYRVLRKEFEKGGYDSVKEKITGAEKEVAVERNLKSKSARSRMKRKLL